MPDKIIIFDLDGTLADCSHRLHYIVPPVNDNGGHVFKKDWRSYFAECENDAPILHTIELLKLLYDTYDIWIVSGRSDECEKQTRSWLHFHLKNSFDKLIMRKAGDFTDDDKLKVSWLDDGTIPIDRVFCVFDDRTRVVNSWRSRGIPCFQVAEGDF